MRVVFMGTPDFVIPVLERLLSSEMADVVAIFTQPDKASGRGKANRMSPVKGYALERDLPVLQPASLRTEDTQQALEALAPDVVVVAAYGKLLPPKVLGTPRFGCINIHPSLLPKHRGPSPVVSAILEGDDVTGVTVMVMDEGMDTGPVVAQRQTRVGSEETAGELTYRLFQMGGQLLAEVLSAWVRGEITSTSQDDSQATVTRKIEKDDGEATWGSTAHELERRVRAFDPWPGLYTRWRGKIIKAVEAKAVLQEESFLDPGTVVSTEDGIAVVTGRGMLVLRSVQLEGRRPMPIEEFVRGQRDFVGSRLPS